MLLEDLYASSAVVCGGKPFSMRLELGVTRITRCGILTTHLVLNVVVNRCYLITTTIFLPILIHLKFV